MGTGLLHLFIQSIKHYLSFFKGNKKMPLKKSKSKKTNKKFKKNKSKN